jgi:hypothetical protein
MIILSLMLGSLPQGKWSVGLDRLKTSHKNINNGKLVKFVVLEFLRNYRSFFVEKL